MAYLTYSELVSNVNLIKCISNAIESANSQSTTVFIHFSTDLLTIETAELITSFLDTREFIYYNFDATGNMLTIKALNAKESNPAIHFNMKKHYVSEKENKKHFPLQYIDATDTGILN